MAIFIILLLLLLVLLSSAEAASGALRVPKLRWHQWFFLFLSSAFLGCLFEMGVVWLGTGVLMSRSSLLYGAISVVWGLGAVLMTLVLAPLRRYGKWAVFGGGVILGGGFEYLTSLVLERVFHRLFWDYSHLPLNLDGRTNLLYAVFWGLAGVLWVYWLAPYLLRLAEKIPRKSGPSHIRGIGGLACFGYAPLCRSLLADGGAQPGVCAQQSPGVHAGYLVRGPSHAAAVSEHDPYS